MKQDKKTDESWKTKNAGDAVEQLIGLITFIALLLVVFLVLGSGVVMGMQSLGLTDAFWLGFGSQIVILVLALAVYKFNFESIKKDLSKKGTFKGYFFSFLAGLAALTVVVILNYIGYFLFGFPEAEGEERTLKFAFIAVLMAPIIEELAFRSGMWRLLKDYKWGKKGFIILSSLIFGLLHIDFANTNIMLVLSFLVAGFVLSYVFIKGDNVKYSMVTHMTYNGTAVAIALILELLV